MPTPNYGFAANRSLNAAADSKPNVRCNFIDKPDKRKYVL